MILLSVFDNSDEYWIRAAQEKVIIEKENILYAIQKYNPSTIVISSVFCVGLIVETLNEYKGKLIVILHRPGSRDIGLTRKFISVDSGSLANAIPSDIAVKKDEYNIGDFCIADFTDDINKIKDAYANQLILLTIKDNKTYGARHLGMINESEIKNIVYTNGRLFCLNEDKNPYIQTTINYYQHQFFIKSPNEYKTFYEILNDNNNN